MSDGWGKFAADVDGLVAKLPHMVEADIEAVTGAVQEAISLETDRWS